MGTMLVTGGAGFVGSHYVRSLLDGSLAAEAPARVVVLDALTYAGNTANLDPVAADPRLRFVHGDVGDRALVDDLVRGVDVVVHFAAESHVDRSIDAARAFVLANVLGTETLLDAAMRHGVEKFVHVSTDEVYGSIEEGSWSEDHALAPSSPYAATKAGSDLLALAYFRTHGVPVSLTRCSNSYGPYQHPEKVIPRFVTTLLDGGTVPLYGDGLQVRDWLHVHDHCRAVQLVADGGRPGEVYHVGGGIELTNRELTERLLALTGTGWERVRMVADRKGHDRRYSLDWSKIRDELGYQPVVGFERGLAATAEWYRSNRHWWEAARATAHLKAGRTAPR